MIMDELSFDDMRAALNVWIGRQTMNPARRRDIAGLFEAVIARAKTAEARASEATVASFATAAVVARIGRRLGIDSALPVEAYCEAVVARAAELEAALTVTEHERDVAKERAAMLELTRNEWTELSVIGMVTPNHDTAYAKLLAELTETRDALAAERAANEWPPVKEAPPESGVYIGWVEGAPFTIAASYDADYDDEDSWPWSDCETGGIRPRHPLATFTPAAPGADAMTPYSLYHQRGSYQDHRLNAAGDGLLCGRPLPEYGWPLVVNHHARPLCRKCRLAWEKLSNAAGRTGDSTNEEPTP